MIEGRASRTALGAALYRAAHQLADRPPVFEDPFALRLVGARLGEAPPPALARRLSPAAGPLRAFIAARSRYAESRFAEAHARGLRQYVVLGAGLDTFAWRCALPEVRVFEVDHPATQAWKRELVARVGLLPPDRAVYAPVDFERDALDQALSGSGLELRSPAFVAWLGVTPYLAPEALRATLRCVAERLGPGTEIVFDFAAPPRSEPERTVRRAFAARVDALGEPLRSELEPATLAAEVRALGFGRVEVLDAAALNALYFTGRDDGLRLRAGQLLWAGR
jgi:methyltransferase (TIGR00027 family)